MDKEEIIRRLKKISEHAVHVTGELPFIISLDDGIALGEAVSLLKEQEKRIKDLEEKLRIDIPLKERNENFDLYDTPIFGFHD